MTFILKYPDSIVNNDIFLKISLFVIIIEYKHKYCGLSTRFTVSSSWHNQKVILPELFN